MKQPKAKRMIGGAMRDERGARIYYTKMINSTKDKKIKNIIREIRNDEIDHFKKLKRMKTYNTNDKGGKK